MLSLNRRLRALVAAVAVIGAFASLSAPAMAEEKPAAFSPANKGMKWSGSLTLYKNGATPRTCTLNLSTWSELMFENYFILLSGMSQSQACSEKTKLSWAPEGEPRWNSVSGYLLEFGDRWNMYGAHESPYGLYTGDAVTVPWTNGSGATASTVTFNKTRIGTLEGGAVITATGTIKATTEAGALLTLTH
jgi:hypothetical protein